MKILFWHVHGTWATAFVQGGHDYLIPVLPGRPLAGRGRPSRPGTFDWPANAAEFTAFSVRYVGAGIDLTRPPLARDAAVWTHLTAYEACQSLGDVARAAGLDDDSLQALFADVVRPTSVSRVA